MSKVSSSAATTVHPRLSCRLFVFIGLVSGRGWVASLPRSYKVLTKMSTLLFINFGLLPDKDHSIIMVEAVSGLVQFRGSDAPSRRWKHGQEEDTATEGDEDASHRGGE